MSEMNHDPQRQPDAGAGTTNSGRAFVLCVDLDGVVADYETAFRSVVAAELGVDEASIPAQVSWDYTECGWGIRDRDHFLELHATAVARHAMFLTMPEIRGASDTLWRLSDRGVHIRVVTHRLVHHWNHDTVVADTVRWLQRPRSDGRPRIPYRDVCFIADKADVGGDLYIDDAPHNIAALRDAGTDAVVFTAGYNTFVDGPRAGDWDDIETLVDGLLRS
jgi:5'-nucleotidase